MTHPDAMNNMHTAAVSARRTFDTRAFRRALGCFPTGVAIITTCDVDGRPVGLTCNSFSSVSLDPPLVLWSLRLQSKLLPAFMSHPTFAVNLLTEDQSELSARFASAAIEDKFDGVGYTIGDGGAPLITDCLARFHCRQFARHEAGDHVVFIGEVDHFDHGRPDGALVYYQGAYKMLAQPA
jgi:flavin reductase (DIM6/NTAB) family NADH-FMN oxidoreductase RutF